MEYDDKLGMILRVRNDKARKRGGIKRELESEVYQRVLIGMVWARGENWMTSALLKR